MRQATLHPVDLQIPLGAGCISGLLSRELDLCRKYGVPIDAAHGERCSTLVLDGL
jgi:hypothetical protein